MLKIPFTKKLAVWMAKHSPSAMKAFLYRSIGAEIGEGVKIGQGSYILAERIILRDDVAIGKDVHIVCREFSADEGAKIAEEVRIDGESTCRIGRHCYIGPRAYINAVKSVVLEDNVGMGGRIYTHGVWPPYTEGYPRRFAPVCVKREAWIPPGTIIFPGVTIGEEAIVGTGAVVTKSVPARAFAAGVPATITKSVDEIQSKLTPSQKEARVKEILSDFGRWIKEDLTVQENQIEESHLFALLVNRKSLFKMHTCGIYYTKETLTAELLKSLFRLRNKISRVVIISLRAMPQTMLGELRERPFNDFFDWADLENYTCKRKGSGIFLLLRGFFRSHYGVRFTSENLQR